MKWKYLSRVLFSSLFGPSVSTDHERSQLPEWVARWHGPRLDVLDLYFIIYVKTEKSYKRSVLYIYLFLDKGDKKANGEKKTTTRGRGMVGVGM